MKRLLCVFGLLAAVVLGCVWYAAPPAVALVSTGDGTWFWRSPQPQGNWLNAVCSEGTSLWAVGAGGTILRSVDAGVTWAPQISGTTKALYDVTFLDSFNGWAVGGDSGGGGVVDLPATSVVLHTSDGGATWTTQRLAASRPLTAVTFSDALSGWAVGVDGVVHTADGGHTWLSQAGTTGADLASIRFSDALHGWIGGLSGAMLRTANGGQTWKRVGLGAWAGKSRVVQATFADAVHGWAILCGSNGYINNGSGHTIVVTSDGGDRWRPLYKRTDLEFTGLAAGQGGLLWAAATSQANAIVYLRSSDWGVTWSQQTANALLPSEMVAGAGVVCAVGSGIVTSADGESWLPRSTWSAAPARLQMFDDTHGVGLLPDWFSQGGIGFARTTDGISWQPGPTLPIDGAWGMDFTDPLHGWVIGASGGILSAKLQSSVLATADGGESWQKQGPPLPAMLLTSVSFADAQHGWVCGLNLKAKTAAQAVTLRVTADGGQSWATQALPAGFVAFALHFVSPLEGWAVGGSETGDDAVAHTVDGGEHWTTTSAGPGGPVLENVWFLDADHGWATGLASKELSRSVVVATTDGGSTWTPQGSGTYVAYLPTGVAFTDARHGWLFAGDQSSLDGGGIWQTSDGGATWNEEHSGVGGGITSVSVVGGHVYGVGFGGMVSTLDVSGDTAPPYTYDDFDYRWHRRPVAVKLVATDIGGGTVAGTEYRIDGDAAWHPYTGPIEFLAPPDHSGDGRHQLHYRSTDSAGNTEPDYAITVPVDTLGPTTSVPRPVKAVQGKVAHLSLVVHEKTSTAADVKVQIRRAGTDHVLKTITARRRVNAEVSVWFACRLAPGAYTFTVQATDLAGNRQTKAGQGRLSVVPGGAGKKTAAADRPVRVPAPGVSPAVLRLLRLYLGRDLAAGPLARAASVRAPRP